MYYGLVITVFFVVYQEEQRRDYAPAFAVNGNATLTFNAAAQEGDIETLRNNNKVYDLQGREVKAPGKGIYIVNGKKVVLTNAR